MRKYALVALSALAGTLVLGACSQNNESAQPQPAAAQQAEVGSSADCTRFASMVTAPEPGQAGKTVAPTLKTGAGDAATGPAAAGSQAKPETFELTPEEQDLQRACYSHLQQLVQNNIQGMTANRPYAYLVPAGNAGSIISQRQRQLDSVTGVVLRGVTPGNLLAFGGPSSTATANLMISAFKQAQPGSMKGVIVLFIGDKADKARVAAVVKPTDATYRFVQM